MLPPSLRQLKQQIEATAPDKRTAEQTGLLAELQKMDSSEEFTKAMQSQVLIEDRQFSAPSSTCRCCGAQL